MAELAAGLLDRGPSPGIAVGDAASDTVSGSLERWVIATRRTADKPVLIRRHSSRVPLLMPRRQEMQ